MISLHCLVSTRGPFNPNNPSIDCLVSPLFLQHLLQLETFHRDLSFLLVILTRTRNQWGQSWQSSGEEKPPTPGVRGPHHPDYW